MKKVLVWGMVLLLTILLVVVGIWMVRTCMAMNQGDIILDVHQNTRIHDMVAWYAELNNETLVEDEIYLASYADSIGVYVLYMVHVEGNHYEISAVPMGELIREYEKYLQERRD